MHLVVLVNVHECRLWIAFVWMLDLIHRTVDVLCPQLVAEVVCLLKKCPIWLQEEVGADDLAEFFLAHLVQPLDLLSREASYLLDDLLFPVAHCDILRRITASDVDVNVDVAVVDEHGLV